MPVTGSKQNKSKPKPVEIVAKDTIDSTHVIRQCSSYIAKNMDDKNRAYWQRNATKRNLTLEQIISLYLIRDFGLPDLTIEQLYK